MENKHHHKPEKNFFLHVYELFLAQSLLTKLFIFAIVLIALTIPALLAAPMMARADSFSMTMNPTDDASVNKSSTKSNYGDDKEFKSDKERTAYLKFNLASLANQPITKATLRMYVTSASNVTTQ